MPSPVTPRVRRRRWAVRLAVVFGVTAYLWVGCSMPGTSYKGDLPPITPAEVSLADELKAHVTTLAGDIGHRNVQHPANLERAAKYIESDWGRAGLTVARQEYVAAGQTVANLDTEIKGRTDEIVVLGAHYDSVRGSPGANDNASGTAAILALGRRLAAEAKRAGPFKRTLRLAAFVNEEPPFFQTELMGSVVYARRCKERGERVAAMVSVETIGCYSDAEGSQRYPKPFSLFYPSRGNFVAFVGNVGSADLVKRIVGRFRKDVRFPSEGAALLGSIEGIGWSDHWAFWEQGYKAMMVTDTAPFRYQEYHTARDTPDRLDYERTARVVEGLEIVIKDLLEND
ncbi:MAG TPA: M28 family peptidase [Tepidisphaeraceae bacterium]|nr:M28 family peptidase [Tepidisphaeraceae bacterium]